MEGFVYFVLGIIVSIAVSRWFYVRSGPSKIAFAVSGQRIIAVNDNLMDDGIKVLFDGREVGQISVSSVSIWNCGDLTIDRNAVKTADPLCIRTKDSGTILSYLIEKNPFPACGFTIAGCENAQDCLKLDFEFLNSQQGCVFRVFHSNGPLDLKVTGQLRSAELIDWRSVQGKRDSIGMFVRSVVTLMLVIVLVAAIYFIKDHPPPQPEGHYPWWIGIAFMLGLPTLATGLILVIGKLTDKKLPKFPEALKE